MVDRIERIPVRDVWEHEAQDFTRWLEQNIDVLNEVLDLELTGAESEKSAGDFNADLLAEDQAGNPIIIENEYGRSDHDHLGKVLTYLTALEAEAAIWIVEDPRQEHIRTFGWLNESSSADFFLIKLEAIKIGDSPPAPLLTSIVEPSEEGREIGKAKEQLSERHRIRNDFWTELLEKANERTQLHAGVSPGKSSWVGTSAGVAGLNYNYTILKDKNRVVLYIDCGKEKAEENQRIFNQLHEHKEEIEDEFGEELSWELLEGKRACKIAKYSEIGGYRSDNWDEIQDEMIDNMIRLHKATSPYINELEI